MSTTRKTQKASKRPGRAGYAASGPPIWHYLLIAIVIVSFALIRVRLRDTPLERDEGEYAYAGQLMLQGIPPYQLAYTMKLPGTFAAYAAFFSVFGESPAAVHGGLLLVNAVTIFLVFLLANRLWGRLAAVVAGTSYALLSTSSSVLGLAGHATHFVVLPAVAGLLVLLDAIESRNIWKFFWSGLLLGLAFVMKQPGLMFSFFAVLYIAKSEYQQPIDFRSLGKHVGSFVAGSALPFLLTCVWMLEAGVFQKFRFWTVDYAAKYGALHSTSEKFQHFANALPDLLGPAPVIWMLAVVGLSALGWSSQGRRTAWLIAGFTLFSFLAVCPGFNFRPHYFILMLPAVALLNGLAVSAATQALSRYGAWRAVAVLFFLGACIHGFSNQEEYLLELDPVAACRQIYGGNPFPEAIQIADYLKKHSSDLSKVAIIGSEPEILFYAHRHSATGYIYTYPLMEAQPYAHTMQMEMASEIEASHPEFVVVVRVGTSWLRQEDSDTYILDWSQKYVTANYQRVGIADILPAGTAYLWDTDAQSYAPQSQNVVYIFKRKTA